MVLTRSNRRQLGVGSSFDFLENLPPAQRERIRQWIKRYRPRDVNKRHRLPDEQPKTERVVTYKRRRA